MSTPCTSSPSQSPDPAPVLLAAFGRSREIQIRVSRVVYQGRERLDFREHYLCRDGQWKPSPKGVGIRMNELDTLIAGLGAVRDGAK
jgi:hypothetical protein